MGWEVHLYYQERRYYMKKIWITLGVGIIVGLLTQDAILTGCLTAVLWLTQNSKKDCCK